MNKRHFLAGAALAGALPNATLAAAPMPKGPTLLTITGAITRSNRGGTDPVRDQMMVKHKLAFEQACALDFAALLALPSVQIRPTLEYDARRHTLRGPRLLEVLKLAGVAYRDTRQLALRAVDGYAASLTLAEVKAMDMLVATHLDGQPMALGGLGPLWAVYDADRLAGARPLTQRFANCPWALYHIEVLA